jgi:hypothetical protein
LIFANINRRPFSDDMKAGTSKKTSTIRTTISSNTSLSILVDVFFRDPDFDFFSVLTILTPKKNLVHNDTMRFTYALCTF